MVAAPLSFDSHAAHGLRPINLSRDLPQVVELLNVAFRPAMQAEGRAPGMTRLSAHPGWVARWQQWRQGVVPGFVWEENGRIVGNVSLLPTRRLGRFIVANVAVHPDYRRRGIARALMEAVLDTVESHGAQVVVLQVRHDNDGAIRLYRSLGFYVVGSMTSWEASYAQVRLLPLEVSGRRPDQVGPFYIRPLRGHEWRAAWDLDRRSLAADLNWPDPLQPDAYRLDLWRRIDRLFGGRHTENWVAVSPANELVGVASVVSEWGRAHALSLRVPEPWRGDAERPLLAKLLRRLQYLPRRHVRLEHPAGDTFVTDLLCEANFSARRTLTVMRYDCR